MTGLELRLSEGKARLGQRLIDAALADQRGALRIGGAGGVVLRPLSFGLRGRLVRCAATAPRPSAELAALVTAASRESETKVLEAAIVDCFALHLAGAKSGGFGFAAEASLLARALGWSPQQIAEAEASEIDALAVQWRDAEAAEETTDSGDGGWTRVVLAPDTDAASLPADDPAELRAVLAQDLLDRGREGLDLSLLGQPAGPPARSPSPAVVAWRDTAAEEIFPASTGLPALSRGDSRPTNPSGMPDLPATPESVRSNRGQAALTSSTTGAEAATSPQPALPGGPDPSPRSIPADAAQDQDWSPGDLMAAFFEERDAWPSECRDPGFVGAPFDRSEAAVIPFPGLASPAISPATPIVPGDPSDTVAPARTDAFEEPFPARGTGRQGRLASTFDVDAATPPQAPPAGEPAETFDSLAEALHRIADLRGIEP